MAAVVSLMVVAVAPAHAADVTASTNISAGDSTSAASCAPNTDYTIERETAIAVDPTDRRHIVAAWQLVPASNPSGDPVASEGQFDTRVVVAWTRDGGDTWHRSIVPNLSCSSGGPAGTYASDPALAFAADGSAVYLAATTNAVPSAAGVLGPAPTVVIVVSASTDGGATWAATPSLVGPGDRPSITADPVDPARAYVSYGTPYEKQGTSLAVSATTDGGRTWPTTTIAYQSNSDWANASSIAALGTGPAGTKLLAVFDAGQDLNLCCEWIMAVRSDDGGRTWTGASPLCNPTLGGVPCPGTIAERSPTIATDPDTGAGMSSLVTGASLAIGPRGIPYVAWSDRPALHRDLASSNTCALGVDCPERDGQVLVSSSTDGGIHWAEPTVVNPPVSRSGQAFEPSIAVTGDGTLGLTYYDFRHDVGGDAALTTDGWFARSSDGGRTWRELHAVGPFDLRPELADFSDYMAIAGGPKDFQAAFVAGRPVATDGPVDVIRTRLVP